MIDDRIVIANIDNNNPGNEVIILTDPVITYPHGALDDILEPTKLLMLGWCQKDNNNTIRASCLKEILEPPEGMTVFENIKPVIMQYSNGTKPSKHIALVASNIDVGSAAYVYNDKSSIQFSSKPIGQGFRWLLILGSVKTTLNKKNLAAILSIFNDDGTLYVAENLELLDRLSSNVIAMDINYDGYEDIIAGDRSGNLYMFASQVE